MPFDIAKANESYAATYSHAGLPTPPSKKLIILTCMDSRIDAMPAYGLEEGEAHIIRNAGARAADALRSIIVSQRMLGTREVAVVGHTRCGLFTFTNDEMHEKLATAHPEHAHVAQKIDFLTHSCLEQAVREDVKYLQEHPLIYPGTAVTGWIFNVDTGKVDPVAP